MIYLRPELSAKSYIVISGGRNDTRDNVDTTTAQEGIKCLDDIWVLDLTPKIIQNQEILLNYNKPEYAFLKKIKRIQNSGKNHTINSILGSRINTPPIWIRVSCFGSSPSPRHSHCATEYNGNLLLFGGIG